MREGSTTREEVQREKTERRRHRRHRRFFLVFASLFSPSADEQAPCATRGDIPQELDAAKRDSEIEQATGGKATVSKKAERMLFSIDKKASLFDFLFSPLSLSLPR